jgi:hypothetical protein
MKLIECKCIDDVVKLYNIQNLKNLELIKHVVILNVKATPYRLSDCYKHVDSAIKQIVNDKSHSDTICFKYITYLNNNNKQNSDEYFKKLINENGQIKKYEIPQDNEFVISLRLSDKPGGIKYKYGSDLNQILEILNHFKLPNVTLVVGLHYPKAKALKKDSVIEDINCLENLISVLHDKGFNVKVKSSIDPDEDFYYLVKAKYYLTTESGYGCIAGFFNQSNFKYTVGCKMYTTRLFHGGFSLVKGKRRPEKINLNKTTFKNKIVKKESKYGPR